MICGSSSSGRQAEDDVSSLSLQRTRP
jgi:hypothetical protein